MGFNMRELKVRGYLLHVDRATIASASVDEVRSQENRRSQVVQGLRDTAP